MGGIGRALVASERKMAVVAAAAAEVVVGGRIRRLIPDVVVDKTRAR